MPAEWAQGMCPLCSAHLEGCIGIVTKLLQICGLCSPRGYSSPYSDEGEAPQAGMLEAPAPTPLLASRSPERPGQERAALLPKASPSERAAQGATRPSRPGLGPDAHKDLRRGPGDHAATPRKGGKGIGSRAASAASMASEDEDFCSTCLEGYTLENPKIWTKCNHHFHLACIYEWMERKQTCPICDTPMSFEEVL